MPARVEYQMYVHTTYARYPPFGVSNYAAKRAYRYIAKPGWIPPILDKSGSCSQSAFRRLRTIYA